MTLFLSFYVYDGVIFSVVKRQSFNEKRPKGEAETSLDDSYLNTISPILCSKRGRR